LFVGSDASLNSRLYVGGDTSMNSRLFVRGDASFNSRLFVGGDETINGSLTINSDLTLAGNLYHPTGYYMSQVYIKDDRNSTSLTSGCIVGLGGCGIGKNLTVGGCINTSLTTAPTSVNSLGSQTIASITLTPINANVYNNLLNFAVTCANYGVYIIDFTCQIKCSVVTVLPYYLVLYTSTTFTLSECTVDYCYNNYFVNNTSPGIVLKYSRIFSCYTPMTIYGLVRVDTEGTPGVTAAYLTATRIA